MPYIEQSKRPKINQKVVELVEAINELPPKDADGAFNYAVTRLVVKLFGRLGYRNFVRVSGGLNEVKDEYRRRVVARYEDTKKDQHGDVFGEEA